MTSRINMKLHTPAAMAALVLSAVLASCGLASVMSPPQARTASGAPAALVQSPTPQLAPAPSSATHDLCALVTELVATAGLGKDPGPGSAPGATGAEACLYAGAGGLFLQVGTDSNQDRSLYESARAKIRGPVLQQRGTFQDLSGLGDAAFVETTIRGGACYVLKGSILGHVTVGTRTPLTPSADALTDLCRAMAAGI